MNDINQRAITAGKKALAAGALSDHPPQFLFVTISGAHLYGFPSPDSDIDLRGSHLLPLEKVIGLAEPDEPFESTHAIVDGLEVDCVSHDLKKYLRLLTKKNGYVLEQIFSPLVVHDGGHLEEIRSLAKGAMNKHVVHHYKGFFRTQEQLVAKDTQPTAKAVLYLFRVVMTGLHLLRTGQVNANILELNEDFRLAFIPDLVARKKSGSEFGRLAPNEFEGLLSEAKELESQLEPAAESSVLPSEIGNYAELNAFLKRLRFAAR